MVLLVIHIVFLLLLVCSIGEGSNNLTLFYFKNQEGSDNTEILYAYFIPKKIEQNSSVTYVHNYDGDIMSLKSNEITQGLLVYFSKTNDVKDWVIHDLGI